MITNRQYSNAKTGLVLLTVLFLTLACPIVNHAVDTFPKPRGLINDFANVISPRYEQKLTQVTGELLRKTDVPVVVVTMPDIGGEDYNEYANRLYAAWGIGKKGEDRGVLIFVTLKERKMRIETGYGIEGLIPDGLAGEIRDQYIIPYLKRNQFGEGLLNGTLAIASIIAKDARVSLTGQAPVKRPLMKRPVRRGSGLLALVPIFLLLLVLFSMGRGRRGGLWPLLLLLFMGRGFGYGGGYGRGGFGGFGGGFGGFGGGLSGGGGAGGGF